MSGIKRGLEKATMASATGVAFAQTGIDRVLWGKSALVYSAKQSRTTGTTANGRTVTNTTTTVKQAQSDSKAKTTAVPKPLNPLDLGLFPILDILVAVDICNILNYLISQSGGPKPPKRRENPTAVEQALYDIQDRAALVQQFIDQFLGSPDKILGKYTGLGPQGETQVQETLRRQEIYKQGPQAVVDDAVAHNIDPNQALQDYEASISGSSTQKFNLAVLVQYIKQTFRDGLKDEDGKAIFSPDDQAVVDSVPGLQDGLNKINDFINSIDRYTDYRNIKNEDFQKALEYIDKLRSYCVIIQSLDFKNPASFLQLLPPSIVQTAGDKLQEWIKPTRAIKTIKNINDSIRNFLKLVEQGQQYLAKGQFILRIGILIVKVLRAIVNLLSNLPIPSLYTTAGVQTTFSRICQKTIKTLDEIISCLRQVGSLLEVIIAFLRYIVENSLQLLKRTTQLLNNLKGCETQKDSEVVQQLDVTTATLQATTTQIQAYLESYDRKKSEVTSTYGKYKIVIETEQLEDQTIVHKRRRGVALDETGVIVAQSDLTFATDDKVIIGEVQVKLKSLGLVQPGTNQLDIDISFLVDDISLEDITVPISDDEINLGEFVDGLPGGKQLRQKTRSKLSRSKAQFASSIKP